MPQRTNDFQELIATIYERIVDYGGKVTKSGMVIDKDTGKLREVDILIEYRYANHNFNLVIECRARSRKDSVAWIEELIGKKRSLAVDKLVAVSEKGFTKTAAKKAQAHGIDTLTVKEAVATDWEKYPIKPGLVLLSDITYRLHDVLFWDGKQFKTLKTLGLDSVVLKSNEEVGSIKQTFEFCFLEFLIPQIQEEVKANFLNIFRKKKDLSKFLLVEIERTMVGLIVRQPSGAEVDISKLKFIVHGTWHHCDVEQKHIQFNKMMVSTGQHIDSDGSKLKFTIVQNPDTKKIHANWKRCRSENS